MDIQTAAIVLLAIRAIAVAFIASVLVQQATLFRFHASPSEQVTRVLFFLLSLVLLFGNFIPVLVDYGTIAGTTERSNSVLTDASLVYAFSNAMTSLGSSVLIWLMYKLIAVSLGGAHREDKTEDRSRQNN